MLDLNVEIASSDSDNKVLLMAMGEEEAKLMGVGGGGKGRGDEAEDEEEHSSGTSDSSSVVNDDESPANAGAENSFAAAAAVFDVFKKGKEESPPPTELVTRQFFPVPGGGAVELGLKPPAPAATLRTQRLNLSFAGGSGGESGGQLLARELTDFKPQKPQQVRKSRRGPRSRSSQYRGVTFYRRTGRWESHIWDCGKQVYLGGFDTAYAAARAYDRAAIKFRGVDADINFSVSDYEEDMKQMGNLTKEAFIHVLRRQSTGFSRGSSKFRGMGLQKCGQQDAGMGEFLGNKAYENSIVQCNQQEAVAGLELGLYNREMVLEATGEGGGGHKLDLSLGIALPSAGDSKRIKATGNYQGPELPMVDCSNASAHNKLLPAWPAAYPFLFPSPEGTAVDRMRAEAPTSSNIGWHMATNGDYGCTSASPAVPRVLPDNAASSGFSSSYSSSNFVIGYNGDPRC